MISASDRAFIEVPEAQRQPAGAYALDAVRDKAWVNAATTNFTQSSHGARIRLAEGAISFQDEAGQARASSTMAHASIFANIVSILDKHQPQPSVGASYHFIKEDNEQRKCLAVRVTSPLKGCLRPGIQYDQSHSVRVVLAVGCTV